MALRSGSAEEEDRCAWTVTDVSHYSCNADMDRDCTLCAVRLPEMVSTKPIALPIEDMAVFFGFRPTSDISLSTASITSVLCTSVLGFFQSI